MSEEQETKPRFYMSDERCVICGKYIPERGMVCPRCEKKAFQGEAFCRAAETESVPLRGKGLFGLRLGRHQK